MVMVHRVLPYENETVMGEMRVQITFEASKVRFVFFETSFSAGPASSQSRAYTVYSLYAVRCVAGPRIFSPMFCALDKDRLADVVSPPSLHLLLMCPAHITAITLLFWIHFTRPPAAYPTPAPSIQIRIRTLRTLLLNTDTLVFCVTVVNYDDVDPRTRPRVRHLPYTSPTSPSSQHCNRRNAR